MNAIRLVGSELQVPALPVIPFIEGDGIGKDICAPSLKLFDESVRHAYHGDRKITWKQVHAGQTAERDFGKPLPEETLQAFREYLVGIKGPLGTPIGEGMRSVNVALRQELDLYACFRPVSWVEGMPSPVRHPERVNMYIFRENTEDVYAGIEYMLGDPATDKLKKFLTEDLGVKKIRFPDTSSIGIKPISLEGSERLARASIQYAILHKLPSVTLVHKGNIMKCTEGAFRKWGYAVAEREFGNETFTMIRYQEILKQKGKPEAEKALAEAKQSGKVIIKDCIADAFLQESLLHPADYSVIATTNLNGDYISDQLAAMVGGISIAPGANINYQSGHAIFEAVHGTAPSIAGSGRANPTSFILSGAMMLEYMGWIEAATLIRQAVSKTINQGKITDDLASSSDMTLPGASSLTTEQFVDELICNLDK